MLRKGYVYFLKHYKHNLYETTTQLRKGTICLKLLILLLISTVIGCSKEESSLEIKKTDVINIRMIREQFENRFSHGLQVRTIDSSFIQWQRSYIPAFGNGNLVMFPLACGDLQISKAMSIFLTAYLDSIDTYEFSLIYFTPDDTTGYQSFDIDNFTGLVIQGDLNGVLSHFSKFENSIWTQSIDTFLISDHLDFKSNTIESRTKPVKCPTFGRSKWSRFWGEIWNFFESVFSTNSSSGNNTNGNTIFVFGHRGPLIINGNSGSAGTGGGNGGNPIILSSFFDDLTLKVIRKQWNTIRDALGLDITLLQAVEIFDAQCLADFAFYLDGPPVPGDEPGLQCLLDEIPEVGFLRDIDYFSGLISLTEPGLNWLQEHYQEFLLLKDHFNSNLSAPFIKEFSQAMVYYQADANLISQNIQSYLADITPQQEVNNYTTIQWTQTGPTWHPSEQYPLIGNTTYRHPHYPPGTIAPDMQHGTNGSLVLFPLNFNQESDEALFLHLNTLLFTATTANTTMRNVATIFLDRFKNNVGGDYYNTDMSNVLRDSRPMRNALKNIAGIISGEIKGY